MKWINKLKVGDLAVGKSAFTDNVGTVTRINETDILVSFASMVRQHRNWECRYRKVDGRLVGSDRWCTEMLLEATPARLSGMKKVKHRRTLIKYALTVSIKKLSTDQLERIVAIMKENN